MSCHEASSINTAQTFRYLPVHSLQSERLFELDALGWNPRQCVFIYTIIFRSKFSTEARRPPVPSYIGTHASIPRAKTRNSRSQACLKNACHYYISTRYMFKQPAILQHSPLILPIIHFQIQEHHLSLAS